MAYDVPETASALSPLAAFLGGGGAPAGGTNNPIASMITALMKNRQAGQPPGQPPAPTGTYEGNLQTPANPFNPDTSSFGMEPYKQMGPTPPMATPPLPTPRPTNPFTQGANPVPFLNGSALFGQPPMGGPTSSMFAQRPNPINQMQL